MDFCLGMLAATILIMGIDIIIILSK